VTDLVAMEDVGDGVVVITMDDQARYNAVSMSMVSALKEAFALAEPTRGWRAAVLTGAGRGFCGGGDMTFRPDPAPDTDGRSEIGRLIRSQGHLAELILAIRELRKPVVAAVHGGAIGGGLGLALACDIRLAAPSATFSARFIRIGITGCDVGTTYLLPRIVGAGRAAELVLTGRDIDAEEAERIGLVSRVVGEREVVGAAIGTAKVLAAHTELGVELTKAGLWANVDAPSLRHAVEHENRTQVLSLLAGQMAEGGKAILERRPPVWKPM